jgi:hypothetical protein
VLLCYDYQNGITDEEDIIFTIELELFSMGTINLPKNFQYVEPTKFTHIDIEVLNHSTKRNSTKFISMEGETTNIYEPRVDLEDKMYPKTYYKYQLGNV